MGLLGRLAATLWGVLLPVFALAQQATGQGAADGNRSAWNWVVAIAALAILIALTRLFFGSPPGGRAGRPAGRT